MTMMGRIGWAAVALLAACCLAVLALSRGEPVSAAWVLAAALSVFAIGYRFHARYIATQALRIVPTRATPRTGSRPSTIRRPSAASTVITRSSCLSRSRSYVRTSMLAWSSST